MQQASPSATQEDGAWLDLSHVQFRILCSALMPQSDSWSDPATELLDAVLQYLHDKGPITSQQLSDHLQLSCLLNIYMDAQRAAKSQSEPKTRSNQGVINYLDLGSLGIDMESIAANSTRGEAFSINRLAMESSILQSHHRITCVILNRVISAMTLIENAGGAGKFHLKSWGDSGPESLLTALVESAKSKRLMGTEEKQKLYDALRVAKVFAST